jgi:hypothetical protein
MAMVAMAAKINEEEISKKLRLEIINLQNKLDEVCYYYYIITTCYYYK